MFRDFFPVSRDDVANILQIIRDMELVWNMPIHLLSPDSDAKLHSNAVSCHKQWRDSILPELAKASHKDTRIFLEIAQEFETEHIAAAAQCKINASQYKKDSSKSKAKSVDIEGQNVHISKAKCRCHRKPCTCGAKSNDRVSSPVCPVIEPVTPVKRARLLADDGTSSDDKRQSAHLERVLDSAEDVPLARDASATQLCKDALESLMKHRRSEFFLVPG